jgi:hypothetical protein
MSDEAEESMRGPVMLAATNMLKPPPAVIGSINKEITLPRTIKLTTLLSVGIGAVLGFLTALIIFGVGLDALIYGPTMGGALGWGAVSFSPLRGESLAKWLGLQANSARQRKLAVDGRPVRLYVGIAPLRRTAAGTVRILPGGVPVDGVSWDERGFPLQEIPRMARLPTAPTRQGRRLTASTELSSQHGRKRRK